MPLKNVSGHSYKVTIRTFGSSLVCQFVLKILNGIEVLVQIMGNNSRTNVRKMTCNNPNLDFVNINAYIEFGINLYIFSQDIERKRNFGINHWPQLFYKYAKKGRVAI